MPRDENMVMSKKIPSSMDKEKYTTSQLMWKCKCYHGSNILCNTTTLSISSIKMVHQAGIHWVPFYVKGDLDTKNGSRIYKHFLLVWQEMSPISPKRRYTEFYGHKPIWKAKFKHYTRLNYDNIEHYIYRLYVVLNLKNTKFVVKKKIKKYRDK
ncbi:hypothetical protein BCV71DRAFT_240297 [Rhizopus microsporus]|uniref:Uncharacterized protein n=1 Tax=Rhizopus microsporus TaxID=58291 RepID=A0A1X0RJK5_RHIZD|nr:hypothetical protein BCV71DRAFT_240297 [Rhizopus microsporus]